MSVHYVYKRDGGAKFMRPIHTREEYLSLRNGGEQIPLMKRIRAGEEQLKTELVQMNYSCLPNEDGSLKGSKTMSTTVGMDIDHIPKDEMQTVRERILSKKDELGLLMLEESARGGGYHLAFKRRPDLSQEANLKWASDLLGVEFDKGAKDITRVFFSTTEAELIYLDDGIFDVSAAPKANHRGQAPQCPASRAQMDASPHDSPQFPTHYHGIPFTDIIAKYWEVNNRGF